MSETVTTGQTVGASYTWASYGYAWNSADATAKTWATAYAASYTADIASTLGFAEGEASLLAKAIAEPVSVSEAQGADYGMAQAESLAAAEGIGSVTAFDRQIGESLSLQLDAITSGYDSHLWSPGVTPSGYSLNQNTAGESAFEVRTGPFGGLEVVNVCRNLDATSDAEGGWNLGVFLPISEAVGSLFAVFARVYTVNGRTYWGLYANAASNAVLNLDGTTNTNPYFYASFPPNLTDWFLIVGYVHPNAYAGGYAGIAGVYNMAGVMVQAATEFKYVAGTTGILHRCYNYYDSVDPIGTETQNNTRPVIIQCTEADAPAKIAAILAGKTDFPSTFVAGKAVAETWANADQYGGVAAFDRQIAESTTIVENSTRAAETVQSEAFATSDQQAVDGGKAIAETWATADSATKDAGQALAETFATGDGVTNGFGKSAQEYLATADQYDDVAAFDRQLAEIFTTADTESSAVAKAVDELFATADQYNDVATFNRLLVESVNVRDALPLAGSVTFPFRKTAQKYTPSKIRYIRDWLGYGSTANAGNHWIELQAYDKNGNNIALNKTAYVDNNPTVLAPNLVNGSILATEWNTTNMSVGSRMTVDLWDAFELDKIIVWHYYPDGRTYYKTKTEVSEDGVNWFLIFDSAIEGEYPESVNGKVSALNALGTTVKPNLIGSPQLDPLGYGISIEEATTNYITAPDLSNNSNMVVGSSSLTAQDFFNVMGKERVRGVTLSQATTADVVSIAIPATLPTLDATRIVSLSATVRCTLNWVPLKTQIQAVVGGVTYWLNTTANTWDTTVFEATFFSGKTFTIGEWSRVTMQMPALPAGTLTGFSISGAYRLAANFTLDLCEFQLEAKPFSTSFVTSSRLDQRIEYAAIDQSASFSIAARTKLNTTYGWRMLGGGWGKWYFAFSSGETNRLALSWIDGTQKWFNPVVAGMNCLEWNHIGFTYDLPTLTARIYANGNLVATQTGVTLSTAAQTIISIGSLQTTSNSYILNGLVRDYVAVSRTLSDDEMRKLATNETASFAAAVAKAEAFGTADSQASDVAIPKAEAVGFAEALGNATGLNKDETLGTADTRSSDVSQSSAETLAVADQVVKDGSKAFYESAAFAEDLGRLNTFSRAIAEGFSTNDAASNAVSLPKSEAFALGDELRRNAASVVSDLLIGQSDITQAQFQTLLNQAQATGYGPFVEFTNGDYEYKNAIFKAVVASTDATRLRVEKLLVNIDVPDVFDSGQVVITAAGATVTFNRQFNAPPEVNASIKGGTVYAVPRIRNITSTSFVVELFDASNNGLAGTISWAAHGY